MGDLRTDLHNIDYIWLALKIVKTDTYQSKSLMEGNQEICLSR